MFKISKISSKDILLIVLLLFFNLLPALSLAFLGSTFADSFTKKIGIIVLSSIVILLPFLFFKVRTAFLINGIALFFVPIEIVHILFFKDSVNSSFIMLILQTDIHEVIELLSSIKMVVFGSILMYIVYFFLVFKFLSKELKLTLIFKYWLIAISTFMIFLLYGYSYYINYIILKQPLKSFYCANETFSEKLISLYPISFYFAIQNALEINHEVNQTDKKLKDFCFGAKSTNDPNQKEVYLLIIGETARYSNFSINGYYRNTNPKLSKLTNLVSFHNVLSEASNTQIALPTILTRSSALDYERYKNEKSVVEAFKEAGFSTYWICNQSAGNPFIKRIYNQCDEYYITTKEYDSVDNYDENLYPFLDSVLSKNEQKQFIVMHTLGSHLRYNFRYPKNYKVFQPDFDGSFGYDLINVENKERLINSYDNSILYTDNFLEGAIQRIKKMNAQSYMFYLSDHAESLFENGNLLHGGKPNYYSMHIPLIIWYSDIYKENNPDKVTNLKNNQFKKVSASVTFHSLLDLAGITLDGENRNKSIASETMVSTPIHYALSPDKKVFKFIYK